jgi:pimeloyl-ACP methyl ester carboxylesterase
MAMTNRGMAGRVRRYGKRRAMATTIEAEDAFDLATCRSPIRAPTLILAGGADRVYSPELFAEIARLIPGSRLRVFARRGHITVTMHPSGRARSSASSSWTRAF